MEHKLQAFGRLLKIMDELREKCPWDRSQTIESLRHLTIEETYELSDSILEKDMQGIRKELGDLMLHLVFYAKIGSETNDFDIADVLNDICDKLVVRHPHIYGDVKVNDANEVKNNWERIKLQQGHKSVLSGVPGSLPALVKAYRIQEKAKGVGFDWVDSEDVWEKIREEMDELHEEVLKGDNMERKEDEFGDLLFTMINYARFIGVNPEDALERTNKKFIKRFTYLETKTANNGRMLKDMTLQEMDKYWEEAKGKN